MFIRAGQAWTYPKSSVEPLYEKIRTRPSYNYCTFLMKMKKSELFYKPKNMSKFVLFDLST